MHSFRIFSGPVFLLLLIQAFSSNKEQHLNYDVATFYWPTYHYEPRIESIFPGKKGEQKIICHPNHKKLLTINVRNKWSEGRYLEPDTLHGLKYLEALKKTQKDN